MLQRIRTAMSSGNLKLSGTGKVDEAYIGGKDKNKHSSKKKKEGRGCVGKIPVTGMKERGGFTVARMVDRADMETAENLIVSHSEEGTVVNMEESSLYLDLEKVREHKTVNRSIKKFVDEMTSTNGIESVWALLKRMFYGTCHKFSMKHLQIHERKVADIIPMV